MSYYTHILAKYDISNCKTFEDVKSKFSDTNPAFLRKVIYLKGLRITEEGKLRGASTEIIRALTHERELVPRKHNVSRDAVEEVEPEHVKEVKSLGELRPELAKGEHLSTTSQKRLPARANSERTKLLDEQIRVLLKKGLASRKRVRSRVPSKVQRTRLTSKFTNVNQHEDIHPIKKPRAHETETTSGRVIRMKLKGKSLEELRKLERSLKRGIELTKGLIESETEHLRKLRQDYYRVKYKRERLEYRESLKKRNAERRSG